MLLKNFQAALVVVPLVLTLPTLAALGAEAPRFISVIEDLPLMTGLNEVGEGVQFSTAQGRIAEVTTTGTISKATVLVFYESTLPQLGWTRVGRGRFTREDETLELVFEGAAPNLSVRFALAPVFQKNKP
ncbi:MAG: hypothetical protein JKY17_05570 [Magnetovibrio sp.]|nr:hypothetical protein [Magnetovibrio sp.]